MKLNKEDEISLIKDDIQEIKKMLTENNQKLTSILHRLSFLTSKTGKRTYS
jgi:hypothetical protein